MTFKIAKSSAFTVHCLSIKEFLKAIALFKSRTIIELSKIRDNRVYLEGYKTLQKYYSDYLKELGWHEYVNQLFNAHKISLSVGITQYTDVAEGVQ